MSNRKERRWYSSEEAANYLGISERNVQGLAKNGQLPCHQRRGQGGVWFRVEDLDIILPRLLRVEE